MRLPGGSRTQSDPCGAVGWTGERVKERKHSRWDKQSEQRYFHWMPQRIHTASDAIGHMFIEYLLYAEH